VIAGQGKKQQRDLGAVLLLPGANEVNLKLFANLRIHDLGLEDTTSAAEERKEKGEVEEPS